MSLEEERGQGVDERCGRSARGRFTSRSLVTIRLVVRRMNVDEDRRYKAALDVFLAEMDRQRLAARSDTCATQD